MEDKTDKNQQLLADKINSILQIRLEELNYEKEAVRSYREIHLQKAINFRGKIFTSAAAIATILIAIFALHNTQASKYQTIFMIFVGLDLAIVVLAEIMFAKYISKTRILWFDLEYEYVSAIYHINNIRIFVASETLESDATKVNQLCILISYSTVSLSKYRIGIVCKIEAVCKSVFLSSAKDIKEILRHLRERQMELLIEAYKTYQLNKHGFEDEKKLLEHLPQLEPKIFESPLMKQYM